MNHFEIIKLIVAYTCTGIFVFTAIITCMTMAGWIKIEQSLKIKLYNVLIIETVSVCIAFYADLLRFNPVSVAKSIENSAKADMDLASVLSKEAGLVFKTNPKLAEAKLAKAASIDPKNYKYRLNLGITKLAQDKYADGVEDIEAANKLFHDLPIDSQAIESKITIASSLIAGYGRLKQFSKVQDLLSNPSFADIGERIAGLYLNIGDTMYQASKWDEAVIYATKSSSIANALNIVDLEIAGITLQANSYYRLHNQDEHALKLINDAIAKLDGNSQIDKNKRAILRADLLNTRGLFKARQDSDLPKSLSDYSETIDILAPLNQHEGANLITLASAHGNRADALDRLNKFDEADRDRNKAIDLFIEKKWNQGVSSQLSEYAKRFSKNTETKPKAYAAIIAAIKLGGNKPISEIQEDSKILSDLVNSLPEPTRKNIEKRLSENLEFTKVPPVTWRNSYGFP